jgi:hypothetical protein
MRMSHEVRAPSWIEWLTAAVVGICLSGFVWNGLLNGGGLVGGDTYPYFYPQKQLMAESFERGEIPLWHDRTSLGYPLHAESQAGIFYPPNQILYRLLDVNAAYSSSVLLHYAFAFVFAWRFIRSQGLTHPSALFAALIFVYGWFPVRISLEWSTIGSVWFPLCLWMTARLGDRPTFHRWTCLVVCLGIHLLAGHFTLAFITQLTCLACALLSSTQSRISFPSAEINESRTIVEIMKPRLHAVALVAAAIAAAMLLAAVQLIPTLELQQLSQRDGTNRTFDPSYGHMPPVYITQLVASWWYWHTPEMALSREMLRYPFLMSTAGTNPVEAHMYVGLIPLFLVFALTSRHVRRTLRRSTLIMWSVLSLAGVVYAFGWLVPLFRHLPGFGFFMGPGRYTMISSLGLAILAGLALDSLQYRQRRVTRWILTLLIASLTLSDVLKSAEYPVCDAQVVAEPPINGLTSSWLAKELIEEDHHTPVRLAAGGPNIANLYGISSVPQYLGLGPSEYFSPDASIETQPTSPEQRFPSADQMTRLRAMAVTHLLTTEPVDLLSEACELVAAGPDAFLNRVWARGSADCFLYRIKEPKHRISAQPEGTLKSWSIVNRRPSDITFQIQLDGPARTELSELMYPGWTATIDGQPASAESHSGFGRIVEVPGGTHLIRWTYNPLSFRIGWVASVVTVIALGMGWYWSGSSGREHRRVDDK